MLDIRALFYWIAYDRTQSARKRTLLPVSSSMLAVPYSGRFTQRPAGRRDCRERPRPGRDSHCPRVRELAGVALRV